MDYFFRWSEAQPLTHANARQVAKFIYEEIICRFNASRVLQNDRGIHFVNEMIQKLREGPEMMSFNFKDFDLPSPPLSSLHFRK